MTLTTKRKLTRLRNRLPTWWAVEQILLAASLVTVAWVIYSYFGGMG